MAYNRDPSITQEFREIMAFSFEVAKSVGASAVRRAFGIPYDPDDVHPEEGLYDYPHRTERIVYEEGETRRLHDQPSAAQQLEERLLMPDGFPHPALRQRE